MGKALQAKARHDDEVNSGASCGVESARSIKGILEKRGSKIDLGALSLINKEGAKILLFK